MNYNVGPNERIARLVMGGAALAAATRVTGWARYALAGIGAAELWTGMTRYCPVNEAMGINNYEWAEEGERDTEIRRHTEINAAMGVPPTAGTTEPVVTPTGDLFGEQPASA